MNILKLKKQFHLELIIAAIFIGIGAGVLDTVFGRVLIAITSFRENYPLVLTPFLPLAGLFIIFLYTKFGGESIKGMSLVFETGYNNRESIPKRLMPLVIVTTWLTHLCGGSVGREGVAVQLGATLSHSFIYFRSLKKYSTELIIVGVAAGFGGLYQTPMAASLFALELLIINRLSLHIILPTFLASYLASQTSHALGLEKFSQAIHVSLTLNPINCLKLLLLGLIFSVVGKIFALSLTHLKNFLGKIFKNAYLKIFIGGILLSIVFLILWRGRYSGLGMNLIDFSFQSGTIYWYDWVLKLVLTVVTIACGFQGGEVTPLFAIGASLGVVLAPVVGLPVILVAALGYVAVFASATNTVLGPLLIMGEIFGFSNLPYAFIVLLMVPLFSRLPSIYSLQKYWDV